jgi:hypothetical protein
MTNDEQTHTMESALRASYADGMMAAAGMARQRSDTLRDDAVAAWSKGEAYKSLRLNESKIDMQMLATDLEAEAVRLRGGR